MDHTLWKEYVRYLPRLPSFHTSTSRPIPLVRPAMTYKIFEFANGQDVNIMNTWSGMEVFQLRNATINMYARITDCVITQLDVDL